MCLVGQQNPAMAAALRSNMFGMGGAGHSLPDSKLAVSGLAGLGGGDLEAETPPQTPPTTKLGGGQHHVIEQQQQQYHNPYQSHYTPAMHSYGTDSPAKNMSQYSNNSISMSNIYTGNNSRIQ